jgi:uncharacterized protein YjdB
MSHVMLSRVWRALVVAAALGGVYACAEKAFAPDAASVVRLNVMTDVSMQLSTVTRTVEIQVGYDRTNGTYVPLAGQSTPVTSGASVQVSLAVNVSSCLSDGNRDAAANVCPLLIVVWIKDAMGTTLDSTTTGPINAKPGTALNPLTVTMTAVGSVAVAPGPDTLVTGATLQLTATPMDAAGNALSGRVVTWRSSAPSVATVSATGLVTAVAAGATTITATAGGTIGTALITVSVPVASVAVTPATANVNVGQTVQLTPTTRDAHGNVLTGRTITWATSDATVATVNSVTGLVTGVAAGGVTITATSEGQSGLATVTVNSVTAADFAGAWSGNIPTSVDQGTFTEGDIEATVLNLSASGGAVTGTIQTSSAMEVDPTISIANVSVTNGVLRFSVPNFQTSSPDCNSWNLLVSGILNGAKNVMTLTLSGTVCGKAPATITGTGTLNK